MDLNYARDTTSGDEGLELVARVKALDPHLPVVVMTAWSTVSLAVATMREGVGDFVQKPWENARLLETVRTQVMAGRRRRRAQRLEADARDVQRRLLGIPAPPVPGYDVRGLAARGRARRRLLARGRVAGRPPGRRHRGRLGKGTPAALLMASVKASLEELVAADLAPRALCARLARTLAPRLGPDRFVSLVYAVLDPARGTLAYANAGHPAPVLLAGRGGRRLKRGGPVLGVVAEADYEEGLLALHRGDRLVLVTDGITEATSRTDAELGDEGLLAGLRETRALTAADAAPRVLELAAGSPPSGLADDAHGCRGGRDRPAIIEPSAASAHGHPVPPVVAGGSRSRRPGGARPRRNRRLGGRRGPRGPPGCRSPRRSAPTVLVFTRTDCPISNRYAPELQRLGRRFRGRGVTFRLVYPDPAETPAAIREHARAFGLGTDVLRDPRHALVRLAGATVTPEAAVFVAGPSGPRLVYRGRIDDRAVDLGRARPSRARGISRTCWTRSPRAAPPSARPPRWAASSPSLGEGARAARAFQGRPRRRRFLALACGRARTEDVPPARARARSRRRRSRSTVTSRPSSCETARPAIGRARPGPSACSPTRTCAGARSRSRA